MLAYTAAKTCANKDGANTKVKCGFWFSSKPGSTPCTTCRNNGPECCTRTFLDLLIHLWLCTGNDNKMLFSFHGNMFASVYMAGKMTCANKDGANTKVKCGSGFLSKPGSTPCTDCADNGNECCTRTFLVIPLFIYIFGLVPTIQDSSLSFICSFV